MSIADWARKTLEMSYACHDYGVADPQHIQARVEAISRECKSAPKVENPHGDVFCSFVRRVIAEAASNATSITPPDGWKPHPNSKGTP